MRKCRAGFFLASRRFDIESGSVLSQVRKIYFLPQLCKEMDFLFRELFDESREQASHYLRELQQLNQRNAILVEEMDQNQQNLETRSQLQLK